MLFKSQNICFVFVFILMFFSLSCAEPADNVNDVKFQYASFKDVPGITEDEINAIETLQKQRSSFIYGMPVSTEAFENENGDVRGYSALLCKWLTDLFGIQFEPKLYEWLDLLAGLETGDISFSGELTATEERLKIYHMTSDIALRPLKFYRLAGSRPMPDIAAERPLHCGFIEGTSTINTVIAELHDVSYEVVTLSDVSLVYDALKNGQIDAFYYSGTTEANFVQYNDMLAFYFYPLVYRPVSVTTQDQALAPIISVVEKVLEDGGMRYFTKLYNQGQQEYLVYKLNKQLTDEEREYISRNPVVPMGVDPGNYPGCFFDKREKEWRGVFLDILGKVASLTGLTFNRVNDQYTEWPVIHQMLLNGEIKLVPELTKSAERAGMFIWPDINQITDYYALISKYEYPDIDVNEVLYVKVGLAKNTAYAAIFRKWFANHMNTVEYESMEEAFDALQKGDVDMVMANQKRLLYLTHYLELPDYKANIVFDYSIDVNIGINRDEILLCSIINKALGSIDSKSISDYWMRRTYDYRSRLAEARRPWYIGSSVLTLFILVLVAVLFLRTHRVSKRLETLVGRRTHELGLQTATLTTLFDSIPDLIFTLDTSLRFTQCNKSFVDHFGLHKEDIINKYENSLRIADEMAEDHNNWNRKVIEEGRTFVIEEIIPRADGTLPLYETVKAPLILNEKAVGVLGIAHDVTERKKMEDAALAASRSKSVFLANMSHEIRTPMNSIVGFSELALDGETTPKTRDYLAKIKTNAEWLLQIINDILDISKIESGKMELEHIPFDMRELFSSCRTLIIPKAIEKGIQLHFYAEPSMGRKPLGDPTRLRQVLVNLLTNAIKFTNTGMVKLHAAIIGKTDDTITMHFEVKDSGIGMSEEQIEKIFEPFVQAETGTTRKYGGTGLGLPITRNIIEMMGGKLSVESTLGLGSKFSFDLTFNTVEESTDGIVEHKIVFNEFEKPMFEGEILLCEDNVMNQQVICEHLTRVGLKTVVAENGKAGVEMVENRIKEGKKQFDLIFMDMHMPVMDGLEAAAKILELKTGVPIVAMTANVMSNDRDIYRNSGMHDCVGKPFTSQELWRCLLKYFKPVNTGAVVSKKTDGSLESDLNFQKNIEKLFVKNNGEKFDEIKKALEEDDIKLAHRLVHSLKSNAAQIGMTSLQKAAADIEIQLKDGKNLADPKQIALLKTELEAALSQLEPPPEDEAQSGGEQYASLEPGKTLELFKELEIMLKNGNIECIKLADALRAVEGSGPLIRQIEDFDFDAARITLAGLKKKLE